MLQTFRTIINSFVGKVFFAVLVGTFGLLGVGYGFRDLVLGATTSNDAATVNGAAISLPELDREFHRQLSDAERQEGPGFSPTAQQKQEMARDTLDQEIMNTLIGQAANHDGFLVSDAVVRKVVEAEPDFAGMDRRFDEGRFRMALESKGMTEATFIPQVRAGLARQLLLNPIGESTVAPRMVADALYRYRNEQRVAETVTIPNASATGLAKPTDADIDAYYTTHAVAFTAPEYRSFTVLPVTPALLAGEITPTEDELRDAYNARKAEFVVPEKRKITQAVVDDKAVADAIAKSAGSGKSLEDAAKAATAGKAAANTIDFLTKAEFPDALRDPVFAAAKGVVAGPVHTILGWHVFRVDDIQAGHDVPFDSAKAKLIEDVKHDDAVNKLAERIDRLGDKLSGGIAMDQVGAEINATPVKIGPVNAKGGPPPTTTKPDSVRPDPARPNPAWVALAFTLQQGETSAFQDDKAGGYYAVRLDQITPPALRPLADVRDAAIAGWTKEQQAAATAKQAEALAAKARAGTPMSQIAAEAGAKLETSQPMTRDPAETAGPDAPALADALFQLGKIGDIATVETDDGQMILRLTEIRAANPATGGERFDTLSREVNGEMQSDTLAQYRAWLRDSAKLKINPRAVDIVAGQ
jgi:peptidyl-prolyl cis-trans isomerase D